MFHISFCTLCHHTTWPWQAQTPSEDHLGCVVQDVWLNRTKPLKNAGHSHPDDWITGGWMKTTAPDTAVD